MNLKYATHAREPFFEIASKYIKFNSIVLDIGAGRGDFAAFQNRNDFYLFDGNTQTVEFLKQSHINVFYGKLPDLPFENDFFDVIHCSHVVEHLQPEQFYQTLKEMNRCLKTNGHLIVSAPLLWEGFFDDLSHVKPYPPVIYKNYLCSKVADPRTRESISNNYSMIEEVYRFKETKLFDKLKNTSGNFLVKSAIKFVRFLENNGMKSYQKTGYTVVLKKQD